jgi:hypothetical protein
MANLAKQVQRALPTLRENAQLIGALTGVVGALTYTAVTATRAFSALQTENVKLNERLQKAIELRQQEAALRKSELEAATANSDKRTLERFLTYGFAEEYDWLRKKSAGALAKD